MQEQLVVRLHRASHRLRRTPLKVVSRVLDVTIRVIFSAGIPGKTTIGESVHFGHSGLGVILNGSSSIGRNCFVGSHVVLGGQPHLEGAPVLEEDVVIHTGSKILGPIIIGAGSVVAANSVVTRSFPPRTLIGGTPARILKENIDHARYRPNAWMIDA